MKIIKVLSEDLKITPIRRLTKNKFDYAYEIKGYKGLYKFVKYDKKEHKYVFMKIK